MPQLVSRTLYFSDYAPPCVDLADAYFKRRQAGDARITSPSPRARILSVSGCYLDQTTRITAGSGNDAIVGFCRTERYMIDSGVGDDYIEFENGING